MTETPVVQPRADKRHVATEIGGNPEERENIFVIEPLPDRKLSSYLLIDLHGVRVMPKFLY
jgi:hypothetical protein